MFGQWRSFTISTERGGVGHYTAYIRDLPKTIASIVENSKLLKLRGKVISNWTEHLTVQPRMLFDSEGRRIVTDFYSGDDLLYLYNAMSITGALANLQLLPVQLFVDKANVTRLNRRLMYPVVLYLLCFSREVRRKLAVNVAFIPIVRKTSIAGKKLPKEVVRAARRSITQKTMIELLGSLNQDLSLTLLFPDQVERAVKPVLTSIVADNAGSCYLELFQNERQYSLSMCSLLYTTGCDAFCGHEY